MDDTQADRAEAQLRAGVYARLSETYDAAESVPTQIERGAGHARRRGWIVAATFKDDGFSGFKEITRDGFGELIATIEAGQVDVVIVREIDRLTRNLTDWNAFEKACVRHGVRLRAYTGGDLDLSTAEGADDGGMGDAAGAAGKRGQERPGPRSPGPGGTQGRADSAGGSGGSGTRGCTRTRTSRTTRSGTSFARTFCLSCSPFQSWALTAFDRGHDFGFGLQRHAASGFVCWQSFSLFIQLSTCPAL